MPVDLDAAGLVREVNTRTSVGLSLIGIADAGETNGAAYVRWPVGHDGVLTRSGAAAADLYRTAEVLALARTRGLPVPRYELIAQLADGVAVVQERLPGSASRTIDLARLDAMISVNDSSAGVLTDRRDIPVPKLALQHSPFHESLAGYNKRSRQLLDRIADLGDAPIDGDDLVHLDFVPENVLFDQAGRLTGIVDWDGSACRGDRRFALIKLRFELAWQALYPPAPTPDVIARLDELLDDQLPPITLRRYWAHWSLRMLDWTIRNFGQADIALHLDLAWSRLQ